MRANPNKVPPPHTHTLLARAGDIEIRLFRRSALFAATHKFCQFIAQNKGIVLSSPALCSGTCSLRSPRKCVLLLQQSSAAETETEKTHLIASPTHVGKGLLDSIVGTRGRMCFVSLSEENYCRTPNRGDRANEDFLCRRSLGCRSRVEVREK